LRKPSTSKIDLTTLEAFLHETAIGSAGLRLRDEDRKKARELEGLLPEIARAIESVPTPTMVDAACGSGWVGLAALALLDRPTLTVVGIERDARKAERAAALRGSQDRFRVVTGDVDDASVWPVAPDLVVALHACGTASDQVIARAAAVEARAMLVVPCCVASTLEVAELASIKAEAMGLPHAGAVRRRFVESFVLGARLLEMESLGYTTEAVAFVGETVTPYNVLLRGRRRANDRARIETAIAQRARLLSRD